MVAAWGGYVFIINVIPIYVVILIVGGRYSSRLYIAYSVFYTMGSLMAMTVPFVGFNVINQAECAASHGVFVLLQVYAVLNFLFSIVDKKTLQRLFSTLAFAIVGLVAFGLLSLQFLGKVQWTGRSLTLLDPTYASKYIPIIASVSEHQPTTWTSFFFDLHILVPLAPVGLFFMFANISDGAIFIILYGTLAWYFAGVMVRLMLTLAPIACILAAIGLSAIITRFSAMLKSPSVFAEMRFVWNNATKSPKSASVAGGTAPTADTKDTKDRKASAGTTDTSLSPSLSVMVLIGATTLLLTFSYHANYVSSIAYSSPSIVIDAGKTSDGRRIMFDDYREAYFWLRQNTHPDAKILSWWDYGKY
jgi:dolichyl-diphosphooligosaccharide--protein glycosyltransferase